MIERHAITSREQWLSGPRKNDITASVIGALFDSHPFTTRLKESVRHRGVEFTVERNLAMRRGEWLEPAVAKAVEELRPDWLLTPPRVYLRDPDLRLGATPDFEIAGDPRGLGIMQAKTVAPSVYERDWDGGETVPMWIVLQCAVEMMLTDAAFGAVAVLLVDAHAMDCKIHELPRNPTAEQKIIAAVRNFWDDVDAGRDPEPDFSRDAEAIKAMFPSETPGKTLDLTGDNATPALLDERVTLQKQIKACDDRITEIDAELKFLLKDHEAISGLPGWKVSFRSTDRAGYSVPAKTIRSLRVLDRRQKEGSTP